MGPCARPAGIGRSSWNHAGILVRGLPPDTASNDVIARARSIVMDRRGVDADEALACLLTTAWQAQASVREVAALVGCAHRSAVVEPRWRRDAHGTIHAFDRDLAACDVIHDPSGPPLDGDPVCPDCLALTRPAPDRPPSWAIPARDRAREPDVMIDAQRAAPDESPQRPAGRRSGPPG